jgi:menaquinone-dependent protoporphyrinogen oxidase
MIFQGRLFMQPTTNRRSFLKIAGVGVAVTAVGGAVLATRTPAMDFFEVEGVNAMTDKVLITYASRCGSTGEVAEAIAQELTARGKSVDVQLMEHVTSLDGYQAVIVGSAIRMGQWLPEARTFVEKYQSVLGELPNAFFTVHMLNTGDDAISQTNRLAYLDSIRQVFTPQQEVYFAGKIELARMSFFDRLISKAMKATDSDERDWSEIRQWSQTVFA